MEKNQTEKNKHTFLKKGFTGLALLLCILLLAALIPPAKAEAKALKLDQTKMTLTAGESTVLHLTKQKKSVKWSVVSGKQYVKLSGKKKTGVKITALKAGTAKVQAKVGSKKLTCKVTVKKKASSGGYTMYLNIKNKTYSASMRNNSSAAALKKLLKKGPLTIQMEDYAGMEKVGPLGTSLPTNDEHINTRAGDLILYQGSSFVIYYDTNSWSLTRLGKINGLSAAELRSILGTGDVTVTLSLSKL